MCHIGKEQLAYEAAKTLLMGRDKMQTEFGVKTEEGLAQMILNNDASTVAHAIMNGCKKIKTCYGVKTEAGVLDLVSRMIDFV